jgi:hypothetical protein
MISLILSVFLDVYNKKPNPKTIAIQLINVLKSITTNCYNPALDKPKAEDINHTTRVNQPKEIVLKDTDSQGLTKIPALNGIIKGKNKNQPVSIPSINGNGGRKCFVNFSLVRGFLVIISADCNSGGSES